MVADRMEGQKDRDDDRTNAWCRAQEAKPPRSKRQHLLGEDRHQRDRTTQKNGEKIERDRAQHHLFMRDEPKPASMLSSVTARGVVRCSGFLIMKASIAESAKSVSATE